MVDQYDGFMLPADAIAEFKELYKKRFRVDLSDQEAILRANNLLSLYRAVFGSNFSFPAGSKKLNKHL
jgi:hypothetical protein